MRKLASTQPTWLSLGLSLTASVHEKDVPDYLLSPTSSLPVCKGLKRYEKRKLLNTVVQWVDGKKCVYCITTANRGALASQKIRSQAPEAGGLCRREPSGRKWAELVSW